MGECCNHQEEVALSCHCGEEKSVDVTSSEPKCQNCSVKKKVR